MLTKLKFRQFEDLTHLACELPDLEELSCFRLTFDSLPAELPRRRPRKSRNKLKGVCLAWTKVAGAEPTSPLAIPMLALFLSVYDGTTFLSAEEAAVILAALSLVDPYLEYRLVCIYDEQTRQLGASRSLVNPLCNTHIMLLDPRYRISCRTVYMLLPLQ